jgi:hypothetical protein
MSYKLEWREYLIEMEIQIQIEIEIEIEVDMYMFKTLRVSTMVGHVARCQPLSTWTTEQREKQLASDEQIVKRFTRLLRI